MAKDRVHSIYEFDGFRLDRDRLMLYRDETEVVLPPKAVETLVVLVSSRGEIVSKDELIDAVWTDTIVEESNLSQYLYLLRKTLGTRPDGSPYIETLRRRGYRFTGDVRLVNGSNVAHTAQSPKATPVDIGIERTGNVLRLVEWPSSEVEPIVREMPAEAVTGAATPPPPARTSPTYFLAAATGAMVVVALVFTISWFRPNAQSKFSASESDLNIMRLTNENYVHDATISRDGNYFAYSERAEGTARIWIQQTGQTGRIEIVPAGTLAHCCKTFSPDGKFLYFTAWNDGEKSALYRVPTLGGTAERILRDVNLWISFSPDGNELVFLRHEKSSGSVSVVIAPSNGKGSERRVLAADSGIAVNSPASWSPDGKKIIFSAIPDIAPATILLYTLDLETGQMAAVSDEIWDTCFRIEWLRDGTAFVLIGTKDGESLSTRRDQVYLISYPGGQSRRLTTDGSRHEPESLGVTDGGSIVAVSFNRASQIWSVDANGDSRSVDQLTTGVGEGRGGMATLPDGRIGYTVLGEHGVSLWTIAANGSNKSQLRPESKAEMLSSTPDGKYFVYRENFGDKDYIYRVAADGGEPVSLTSDETDSARKGYTSISPDGLWVAYDSSSTQKGITHTIKKISIDGGTPQILVDDGCGAPEFSPDGRYISCSYYDKNRLAVRSAVDGSVIATFDAVTYSPLEPKWSPDSQSLVYIVQQNNVCNLWKQPISGGIPEPLTDFTSGQCHNFVYSRDGSRIHLARGYEARDAILISPNKK